MSEVPQVRCPLCGMHAPEEQVEYGPYILEAWLKTLGGKRPLTDEELEVRPYMPGRGRSPGQLQYEQVELSEDLKAMVREKIAALTDFVPE